MSTRAGDRKRACIGDCKCACIGDDIRALNTSWATNSKEINCYLNLRDEIPMAMPKPLAICAHRCQMRLLHALRFSLRALLFLSCCPGIRF